MDRHELSKSVSDDEIMRVLKRTRDNKAPDIDGFNTIFLNSHGRQWEMM